MVVRDSSSTSNSSEEDTESSDNGFSVLPEFHDGEKRIPMFKKKPYYATDIFCPRLTSSNFVHLLPKQHQVCLAANAGAVQ